METIISVKNLVKKYKDLTAVDSISFDVEKGTIFAFLGENGAGKSTTINILCNVLKKTSGEVIIDNINLDDNTKKISNSIGIVFQNTVLDPYLTIKENLILRGYLYSMNKKEILKRIDELDKELELKDILKRRYDKLSGGQKRRVDIARALIHSPKILFLDEPTTGLDPRTRSLVWSTINNLKNKDGITIFLTTHYMEETLNSDNIVILDHGKIVVSGTPSNLKSKYSKSKLIVTREKSGEFDNLLNINNFKFDYKVDSYYIYFDDEIQILDFIENNRKFIKNFEVIKGNMDDVFLAVTGRKLEV